MTIASGDEQREPSGNATFTPFGLRTPPLRLFQYELNRSGIVAGTTELGLETGNQAWIRVTDVTRSVPGRSQGTVLEVAQCVKVDLC